MTIFGLAALTLAAVGIYGVIAYAVAQRLGEMATRMALGATPRHIFWLVVKQGRALAVVGILLGLALAYSVGRLVTNQLFEVSTADPWVLGSATALVIGITAVAMLIPALRASAVDPAHMLRSE
jgi:ABC-type antimicrobial peptide transport system permease subunit